MKTPVSLLEQLRLNPDNAAWQRLVDTYRPWLQSWLQRQFVQSSDADDLIQEVLHVVFREIAEFEHNRRTGAFRKWLRTVLFNRMQAFWKAKQKLPRGTGDSNVQRLLEQFEDPSSEISRAWEIEHDTHVANRLLVELEPQFQPTTWRAFQAIAVHGKSAAEVADELNISVNAVLCAKSRVLRRLRKIADGLLD